MSPGGTALLSIAGELDLATEVPVRAALDAVLAQQPVRVVFDLARIEFIDSSWSAAGGRDRRGCRGVRGSQPILRRAARHRAGGSGLDAQPDAVAPGADDPVRPGG